MNHKIACEDIKIEHFKKCNMFNMLEHFVSSVIFCLKISLVSDLSRSI